jgi:hypothetical protein
MTFDPLKHPRGEHGHWARTEGVENEPDPRVMDVGGDEWNKETARKLEETYAKDRPALNALASDLTHGGTLDRNYEGVPSTSISDAIAAEHANKPPAMNEAGDEDEDEVAIPKEFDELTSSLQSKAEDEFLSSQFKSALDYEQESWMESNGAAESGRMVAEDDDWRADALGDIVDARAEDSDEHKPEERIPYSADDLYAAVKLDYDHDADDGYPHVRPENVHISFDDSKLQNPDDIPKHHPDQMQLPGLPVAGAHDYSDHLTQEMRDDITASLKDAFVERAEKKEHMLEPPDYLEESAKEAVQQQWNDMDDEQKFNYVKNQTNLLDYYEGLAAGKAELKAKQLADNAPLSMPKKLDPMQVNENSSEYVKTQRLLKAMADQRAVQIMGQRGIVVARPYAGNFENFQTEDLKKFLLKPDLEHSYLFSGKFVNSFGPDHATAVKNFMRRLDDEVVAREHPEMQPVSLSSLHQADDKLWEGWKGSSTGNEGRLLQMAVADELGGRIRDTSVTKNEAWRANGFESPDAYEQWNKGNAWSSTEEGAAAYPKDPHAMIVVDASAKDRAGPAEGVVMRETNDVGNTGWTGVYVPSGLSDALGDMHHFFKLPKSDPLAESAANTRLEYNSDTEKVQDGFSKIPPSEIPTTGTRGVILDKDGRWVSRNSPEGQDEIARIKVGDAPTYQNPKSLKAESVMPADFPTGTSKQMQNEYTYTRLPEIKLDRNGASSATLDPAVANRWNGTPVYDAKPRDELIEQANRDFASIGGYEGIKAAIRAKWEVTQWALDHADMPTVQTYRGLTYHHIPAGESGPLLAPKPTGWVTGDHNGFQVQDPKGHMSTVKLNENHVATVGDNLYTIENGKLKVHSPGGSADDWKEFDPKDRPASQQERIVLRADVPRTAVVSIPAYGQNIHSEHEVILGGLGWRGWDAWSDHAPTFEAVPMAGVTPSSFDSDQEAKNHQDIIDTAAAKAYASSVAPMPNVESVKAKMVKDPEFAAKVTTAYAKAQPSGKDTVQTLEPFVQGLAASKKKAKKK